MEQKISEQPAASITRRLQLDAYNSSGITAR